MGSGYRTFTAGEVLTASNVQNYLMDQSVMSFADSTARATGIGTANFEEGMLSYLADTNQLEVYDGAAWSQIGQTPGLVKINTTSFSGVASQTINDVFSATYTNYKLVLRLSSGGAAGNFFFRLRVAGADNSTNNYYSGFSFDRFTNATGNGAANPNTGYILPAMTLGGSLFSFDMDVLDPFNAIGTLISYHGLGQDVTSGYSMVGGGYMDVSSSFTGFSMFNNAGDLGTGTISVYGFNK